MKKEKPIVWSVTYDCNPEVRKIKGKIRFTLQYEELQETAKMKRLLGKTPNV